MDNRLSKSTLRKMKALSDGTRIKLAAMLRIKPLCVCELTYMLGLAQPTVSRHLRQLEDAGFINSRREGPWTIYYLDPEDDMSNSLLGLVMDNIMSETEWHDMRQKLDAVDRYSISGDGRCSMEGNRAA